MDPNVDAYIERSERWPDEIRALQPILLASGLTEQLKWGKPCYSHGGHNLAIVQEMKDFLALMFFNGALLDDPAGVLESQGPNSRSALRVCMRSVHDVECLAGVITSLVASAIEVESKGLKVQAPPTIELVAELQTRLDRDPPLRAAFEALTPGRRREYNLYISAAKQAVTREARIDKHAAAILAGKGLRE